MTMNFRTMSSTSDHSDLAEQSPSQRLKISTVTGCKVLSESVSDRIAEKSTGRKFLAMSLAVSSPSTLTT